MEEFIQHTIYHFGRLQRRNGEISRIEVGEGFFTKDAATGQWSFHTYVRDRLGSVVAVTDRDGAVEQHTLYFASGLPVVYDDDPARPVQPSAHWQGIPVVRGAALVRQPRAYVRPIADALCYIVCCVKYYIKL